MLGYSREEFAEKKFWEAGTFNGLKTVNDTQGHAAEDIVARIGGDEFAVLLPGTDATIAEEAVGRVMSSPEITKGLVSIAFGVASAENREQLAEALKLSDDRMYRDKLKQKEL
jgi:diguanylate cyclase (GGDEF)-like protein